MNRLFAAPVAIGAMLLLLAGAIGLGWIWLRAGRPEHIDPWQVAVLLIPLALLGVAVLNWGADRAQIAITVWVVVMFGGLLPLLVALHVGAAGPPGSAEAKVLARYGPELTPQQRARLFEGAVSDETTHDQGRAEAMRIGMFADDSVLLLFHFRFHEHATDHVNLLARQFGGSKHVLQTNGGLTLAADQRFNHLRQYGGEVLSLTGRDAAALRTRVEGWQLPPPGAIASRGAIDDSRSVSPGFAQWPFGVAYGVSWVALLIGFMLWLAPWAATVPPPPHLIPVAQQTLHNRLLALQALAPALQWEPGERPDELSILYVFHAGKRRVKMRLRLDAQHGRVLAKEYSGVKGDAPITDSEAQIRFMARRAGERVRPSADVVYSSDWNVTMPTEEKRRSLGVRVLGDAVQLPPQTIAHFTADGPAGATDLPHLLAEIVHQSGWQWKGVFLF